MTKTNIGMSYQFSRLSEYLSTHASQLANLLSVLGHPIRFTILAFLISGPKDFGEICDNVEESSTTVSNHLSQLFDIDLISKIRRGRYEISKNGLSMMEQLALFQRQYQSRQLKKLQGGYLHTYPKIEEINMKSNRVRIKPEYQSCWNSFTGAIAGILQSYNEDFDVVDVAGLPFKQNNNENILQIKENITLQGLRVELNSIKHNIQSFEFSLDYYLPVIVTRSNMVYPLINQEKMKGIMSTFSIRDWRLKMLMIYGRIVSHYSFKDRIKSDVDPIDQSEVFKLRFGAIFCD